MKNLDRFKFRVFYINTNEMFYCNFGEVLCSPNLKDYIIDKNCILMQCTGLRDKNNKLVYENDIVSFSLENHLGEIEYYKSTVELRDDFYWFADRLDFENVFDLENRIDNKLNCEVVGNVYECNVKKNLNFE